MGPVNNTEQENQNQSDPQAPTPAGQSSQPATDEQKSASDAGANTTDLSFGQKAVGLSFNPGGSAEVQSLKQQAAQFIDLCNDGRDKATDPEVKRMYAVAITEAQTAQMWAVKAATWQS